MKNNVIEKLEKRLSVLDASIMFEHACGRQHLLRCKKLCIEYNEIDIKLNNASD